MEPADELFQNLARGKRCPDCGLWKPLDDFPRNKRTTSGWAVYCKPCHNARGRESTERLYGGTRHYHLKHRYGIGADDFDALVAQQGGVCAICGREAPEHVDHSHDSGAVRGILCFNCNGGLGQFRDSVNALVNAAAYLQAHDPEVRALDAIARVRAGELARTPG